MTYVQPGGPARPSSARIRILGCDPPPPRQPSVDWRLIAACVAVAAAGVGITLGARAVHPQVGTTAAGDPPPAGTITLMGHANPGARLPSRHIQQVMTATAKTAGLPAAARYAARAATPAGQPAVTTVRPAITVGNAPANTPVATAAQPSVPSGQGRTSPTIGPEQPLDPVNPNSQIDAS